jgi:hypothetical protein
MPNISNSIGRSSGCIVDKINLKSQIFWQPDKGKFSQKIYKLLRLYDINDPVHLNSELRSIL